MTDPEVKLTLRRRELLEAIHAGNVGYWDTPGGRRWRLMAGERAPSEREMIALARYWRDGPARPAGRGTVYRRVELSDAGRVALAVPEPSAR